MTVMELKANIDCVEKIRLEWDEDRDHQYSQGLEEVIAPLRSFVEQAQRVVDHGRSVIYALQSEHARRMKAVCNESLNQLRSELSACRHEYQVALETFITPTMPCVHSTSFSLGKEAESPTDDSKMMRPVKLARIPTALIGRVPALCAVFDTHQSCRDQRHTMLPDDVLKRIIPMILKVEQILPNDNTVADVAADTGLPAAATAEFGRQPGGSAIQPEGANAFGAGGVRPSGFTGFSSAFGPSGFASQPECASAAAVPHPGGVAKAVLELVLTTFEVPLPPDLAVCSLAMLPPDMADLPSFIEMITEPDSKRLLHGLWSIRKLDLSLDTVSETWSAMISLLTAWVSSNVVQPEQIIAAIFETICALPIHPQTRDTLLDVNSIGIAVLWGLNHAQEGRTVKMAASVAYNLVRVKPSPSLEYTINVLQSLAELIRRLSGGKQAVSECIKETLNEAYLAVSHITSESEESPRRIQALLNTGLLPHAVELLHRCDDPTMLLPALRVIGNVSEGSDEQAQAAMDSGLLTFMGPLLRSQDRALRTEALWTLSNIAAGNRDQIQAVIDSGLLATVVQESLIDSFMSVRKEAVWILNNVCTGGNRQQIESVVHTYEILDRLREVIKVFFEPNGPKFSQMRSVISVVLETLKTLIQLNSSWRVDFDSSWIEKLKEIDDTEICRRLNEYQELLTRRFSNSITLRSNRVVYHTGVACTD